MKVLIVLRRFSNSYVHLPYVFARGGFEVLVVCRRSNYIRLSRWVRRCHFVEDDDLAFSRKVRELALTRDYQFVQLADEPALIAIYNDPASADIGELLPMPFGSDLA